MTYYTLIEANDHNLIIGYRFQKVFRALLIGAILLLTLFYTILFYCHALSAFLILLGSISIFPFIIFSFYIFIVKANALKEICFDRHGLRHVYKTHTDHRPWTDLVGVNFNSTSLRFQDGTTVKLPGLRTLMPVLFRILDRDSAVHTALRTAWKAYQIGERQGYISLQPHDSPKKTPQPHSAIEITPDQIRIKFDGKPIRNFFVLFGIGLVSVCVIDRLLSSFNINKSIFPYINNMLIVLIAYLIGINIGKQYGEYIDFFYRTIQITAHGLSRTSWFGKTRHWAWDSLSGVDFQKGLFQFEDGSKTYLTGRIGYDLSPIIELVGSDSRLANAWEDYLSNPQPKRGLIRC